ncbi:MAG: hypothetical protein COA57_14795 [Flavobacteriales bacterium]|nr:MAG: hypothetical protein COA57_14795 [Flavobacteriales bacterium]
MKRDDILRVDEALYPHHDEEHGKVVRKKIVFVTILLTVVTAAEVLLGVFASGWIGIKWELVKTAFIVMTLVKAGYIVMIFMHLGDEIRSFKWVILGPYILFICYLVFICLYEALALRDIRQFFEWIM